MPKLKMTIYSDYICPWCYVGAVRFQRIKEEFKASVQVVWKAYMLFPVEHPGSRITPHSVHSRLRARTEEPEALFNPWDESVQYPGNSWPAQLATRASLLQGEDAFERYHLAVFRAFFGESKNISDPAVLLRIAEQVGLDIPRLERDRGSQAVRDQLAAEHEECKQRYGAMAMGIPLVTFDDGYPIIGAAEVNFYRHAIQRLQAPAPRLSV